MTERTSLAGEMVRRQRFNKCYRGGSFGLVVYY